MANDKYYDSAAPSKNGLLNPDGSITTFDGTPVRNATAAGVELYEDTSPMANKFLNPDGSIKTLAEIMGGGGGGGVTPVQVTGQSTSAVMSQKATTDMIFNPDVKSVQVGRNSSSTNADSMAMGNNSTASAFNSMAMGFYSTAHGSNAVAIGATAKANAGGSLSIGSNSDAGSGTNAIAMGTNALVANKAYSASFGSSAECSADYAVALGYMSKSTEAGTVSVGDGSTNANYGFRRIVNVKDPINDQDGATKKYVDSKSGGGSITPVQIIGQSTTDVMSQKATTDMIFPGGNKSLIKIGDGTASGNLSIAVGGSVGSTTGATAVGFNCSSSNNATSVGYNSSSVANGVSLGNGAICSAQYGAAIGYGSKVLSTEQACVSVGSGSTDPTLGTRRIINVKDPVNNQDGATKKYVDTAITSAIGAVLGGSY
jgi:hypothetical protein